MLVPTWVWEDPDRIQCSGGCRITDRQADGIACHSDGRHLQTLIFGRDEQFTKPLLVEKILRTMEERLQLDCDEWRWQNRFFRNFIQSFFESKSEPAWVKIAASRLSFRQRISGDRGKATHFSTCYPEMLYGAESIGREVIRFYQKLLPTNGLRMKYRAGIPRDELSLYKVTISRILEGDGLGGPQTCVEDWIHLGTRDREEKIARKHGVNLALKDYPDADPLGRMSPLVSFCRMTKDRQWIISRCVSLCPGSGEVLDFRSVVHRTDFYFRSDLSNAFLLSMVLTPGQYERF